MTTNFRYFFVKNKVGYLFANPEKNEKSFFVTPKYINNFCLVIIAVVGCNVVVVGIVVNIINMVILHWQPETVWLNCRFCIIPGWILNPFVPQFSKLLWFSNLLVQKPCFRMLFLIAQIKLFGTLNARQKNAALYTAPFLKKSGKTA